jgi:hypothetical protein
MRIWPYTALSQALRAAAAEALEHEEEVGEHGGQRW